MWKTEGGNWRGKVKNRNPIAKETNIAVTQKKSFHCLKNENSKREYCWNVWFLLAGDIGKISIIIITDHSCIKEKHFLFEKHELYNFKNFKNWGRPDYILYFNLIYFSFLQLLYFNNLWEILILICLQHLVYRFIDCPINPIAGKRYYQMNFETCEQLWEINNYKY